MLQCTHQYNLPSSVYSGRLLCCTLNENENQSLQTYTIAYASTQQTITLYTPHTNTCTQLSINRPLTTLISIRHVLYIGTTNNLLAYDASTNTDKYYIECADGVLSCCAGDDNTCVVGGSCSVSVYDDSGREIQWSVAGDAVTAITTRTNQQLKQQLIVCSKDCIIRIFENDSIVHEIVEGDTVYDIISIDSSHYIVILNNGNIAAYDNATKLWSHKSISKAICCSVYDINNDGISKIAIGYDSGLLEFRVVSTGDTLIHNDQLHTAICSITVIRSSQSDSQLLVSCIDGSCRVYSPSSIVSADSNFIDTSVIDVLRAQLQQQRLALQAELNNHEQQFLRLSDTSKPNSVYDNVLLIPPDTTITINFKANKLNQCCMLTLNTNNDTVIKLAIVTSQQLFDNGVKSVHPARASSTLSIPIKTDRNITAELHIYCVVGTRNGADDHVFELDYELPRFASFIPIKPRDVQPNGSVQFTTSERVNRVALWLNSAFNVDDKTQPSTAHTTYTLSADILHAGFISVRDNTPVVIKMNNNTVQIRCDSMELCGDIMQDLCQYLRIEQANTIIDFPQRLAELNNTLNNVDTYNIQRIKMISEIADTSITLKSALIKSEDSRLLRDMNSMSIMYAQLHTYNQQLTGEYNTRANNHNELLRSLKHVNNSIQHASRLRVGDAKLHLVQSCRQAIKNNQPHNIVDIIKSGTAA